METDNEYYEVRVSPGKGYGCFALKPIKRGTRILEEKALFKIYKAYYTREDVESAYSHLSPEQKAIYSTLASNHGQDPKQWPSQIHHSVRPRERQRVEDQHEARIAKEATIMSIFQTNCMEMRQGTGLYVHASRFNHSCNPNAAFSFNGNLGMETVHIMHDVAEGEELTFSYCDMSHDKATRAWELKHYGFKCDCRACTEDERDVNGFAYKSRVRRFRIMDLESETRCKRGLLLESNAKDRMFVTKLVELATLYLSEGNYSARLAGVYLDIVLVCEMHNDLGMAVRGAAKAEEVKRMIQGTDHPEYELFIDVKNRVEAKLAEVQAAQGDEVKTALVKANALLEKATLEEVMAGAKE
ncbi:SET domain-containing protein [Pyrenochaeta sp. DS3sAY3a]|nr:SET domain-containing protein [Pyrenochaeta sp. DS3sAY3a]